MLTMNNFLWHTSSKVNIFVMKKFNIAHNGWALLVVSALLTLILMLVNRHFELDYGIFVPAAAGILLGLVTGFVVNLEKMSEDRLLISMYVFWGGVTLGLWPFTYFIVALIGGLWAFMWFVGFYYLIVFPRISIIKKPRV